METSFITQYEKAIAFYLESQLEKTKVKLWADAFSSDSSVQQRSMMFLGHQKTNRSFAFVDAESLERVYLLNYEIEIRAETFSLENHQECLELIEYSLDSVLNGYRPYNEFSGFTPQDSGNVNRDKSKGSWIYSATGTTSIFSNVCELTDIATNEDVTGRITEVSLINSNQNKLIGTLKRG